MKHVSQLILNPFMKHIVILSRALQIKLIHISIAITSQLFVNMQTVVNSQSPGNEQKRIPQRILETWR